MSAQQTIDAIPEGELVPKIPDTYTAKSGVVLKLKRVSPLLVSDAQKNIEEPKVPLFANLDKDPDGSVMEENPNDPDYAEAMQEYRRALGELMQAIYMSRGTEPVKVPEGMESWEDKGWSSDIQEIAGISIPEVGKRRYWCWLKYVALDNVLDLSLATRAVMRLSGVVMEEDVAEAEARFPSGEEGDTAEGVRSAEGDGLGNTNQLVVSMGSS